MQRREQAERWFRQHADRVLAYLLHRSDPTTAEEVLQEVFIIAYRRAADVEEPAIAWLFGTARRVLANHRRGGDQARSLVERLAAAPAAVEGATVTQDAVAEALARLSLRDQEVLTLSYWYQLTAAEASASLGCSPQAYAVRLHRARTRLSTELRLAGFGGHGRGADRAEVSHV